MDTKNTTHTPGDLADFVAEDFASMVRKDQRTTSSFYLQGLMLEGRRKSMQPMAERLGIDTDISNGSRRIRLTRSAI